MAHPFSAVGQLFSAASSQPCSLPGVTDSVDLKQCQQMVSELYLSRLGKRGLEVSCPLPFGVSVTRRPPNIISSGLESPDQPWFFVPQVVSVTSEPALPLPCLLPGRRQSNGYTRRVHKQDTQAPLRPGRTTQGGPWAKLPSVVTCPVGSRLVSDWRAGLRVHGIPHAP